MRLNRLKKSLDSLNKAIELEPDDAIAYYNMACILSLLEQKNKSLSRLKKAVKFNDKSKKSARENEDFKDLWDDPEFIKITSE